MFEKRQFNHDYRHLAAVESIAKDSSAQDFPALIRATNEIQSSLADTQRKMQQAFDSNAQQVRAGQAELGRTVAEGTKEIARFRDDTVEGLDDIVEGLDHMTFELGYGLVELKKGQDALRADVAITNVLIEQLGTELKEIVHLIGHPSEVAAIELIDQSRVLFAIGKRGDALVLTAKAVELCPTSIAVLAHHVVALCGQKDDRAEEVNDRTTGLAKVCEFLLENPGIRGEEINRQVNVLIPITMHAISMRFGVRVKHAGLALLHAVNRPSFLDYTLARHGLHALMNTPTIFGDAYWLAVGSFAIRDGGDQMSRMALFLDAIEKTKRPIKHELQLVSTSALNEEGRLHELLHSYFTRDVGAMALVTWLEHQGPEVYTELPLATKYGLLAFAEKSTPELSHAAQNTIESFRSDVMHEHQQLVVKEEAYVASSLRIASEFEEWGAAFESNEIAKSVESIEPDLRVIAGFRQDEARHSAKLDDILKGDKKKHIDDDVGPIVWWWSVIFGFVAIVLLWWKVEIFRGHWRSLVLTWVWLSLGIPAFLWLVGGPLRTLRRNTARNQLKNARNGQKRPSDSCAAECDRLKTAVRVRATETNSLLDSITRELIDGHKIKFDKVYGNSTNEHARVRGEREAALTMVTTHGALKRVNECASKLCVKIGRAGRIA